MATITPPPARPGDLGEYQRRVRSPLARLRGTIRVYVSLEGALLLVLYVALWFWISLTLDYGLFKLTAVVGLPPFDWVQAWPWCVRLVLLIAVSGAIARGRVAHDVRPDAGASSATRRWPWCWSGASPSCSATASSPPSSCADLKKAEEQGYSPAMILETVHEASERVEKVPGPEGVRLGPARPSAASWRRC